MNLLVCHVPLTGPLGARKPQLLPSIKTWSPTVVDIRDEKPLARVKPTTHAREKTATGVVRMMTFLAGPHACIGRQMAMMEMKAVLARLITQYKFTVAPEQLIAKPSMFRIVQPQISLIHCSVALMITSKIEHGLKLHVQKISS